MNRWSVWGCAAVALGVAWGCAGPREAVADVEEVVPGLEETRTGVVTEVEEDRIAVTVVDEPMPQPVWFERIESTRVQRGGMALSWTEVTEGTPVRVHFEPATGAERTFRVEVLTGQEAEEVRRRSELLEQE